MCRPNGHFKRDLGIAAYFTYDKKCTFEEYDASQFDSQVLYTHDINKFEIMTQGHFRVLIYNKEMNKTYNLSRESFEYYFEIYSIDTAKIWREVLNESGI